MLRSASRAVNLSTSCSLRPTGSRERSAPLLSARIAAATLAAALCNGCMSLEHLLDPEQKLEMYGGTTRSWKYIDDEQNPVIGSAARLIDLPFTAVLDTLILPVTAPIVLSR